jgi:hypothetical protein
VAGVSGIRADTGKRALGVTRQYRPRQLRMGRQCHDAQSEAKVDPDIMRMVKYVSLCNLLLRRHRDSQSVARRKSYSASAEGTY